MTDQVDHLSLEEVGRLLSRQRQPDLLRLAALAETWIRGVPRRCGVDLLSEALTRILSGSRPWPAHVPLPAFLSQVMRSIASQWRHEDNRETTLEDGNGEVADDEPIQAKVEFADLTHRMRAKLEDDPQARGVFDGILTQMSREQICIQLEIDLTTYDTARRRMARTLRRECKPGWNL